MAAEYEQLLGGIKITSKYANGYVYLIVEVDNPLLDSFIQFIHNVNQHQCRYSNQCRRTWHSRESSS